tara:strand:+ start:493 stop:894 length:402 start_codon:yes stop_codon:yes gene_type:complete
MNHSKIKMSSNKSFGIVFCIVFLIFAIWPLKNNLSVNEIKTIPIIISLAFLLLGLINSKILTPLNILWFKFGLMLGAIISPIIMGIVFFAVVTPTGLIMKIFGKDLLKKKLSKNNKSYWIETNKSHSSMKYQF